MANRVSLQLDGSRSRRRDFSHLFPSEGPPRAFRIDAGLKIDKDDFFKRYASLYGLGTDDRMVPVKQGTDNSGYSYTRYVQHHGDVPVIGGEVVLTHWDGSVVFGLGRVIPGLTPFKLRPTLSKREATERALAEVPRATRQRAGDLRLLGEPSVSLVLASERSTFSPLSYRLAYRAILNVEPPVGQYIVDIHADSGMALNLLPQRWSVWASTTASGTSPYNGTVTFAAEVDDE